MAKKNDTEPELWLELAMAAISRFTIPDIEDSDDMESAVDMMIDLSTQYADGMLDEFSERYGGGTKKRRKKKEEEEEED